jgi:hypothetical protein
MTSRSLEGTFGMLSMTGTLGTLAMSMTVDNLADEYEEDDDIIQHHAASSATPQYQPEPPPLQPLVINSPAGARHTSSADEDSNAESPPQPDMGRSPQHSLQGSPSSFGRNRAIAASSRNSDLVSNHSFALSGAGTPFHSFTSPPPALIHVHTHGRLSPSSSNAPSPMARLSMGIRSPNSSFARPPRPATPLVPRQRTPSMRTNRSDTSEAPADNDVDSDAPEVFTPMRMSRRRNQGPLGAQPPGSPPTSQARARPRLQRSNLSPPLQGSSTLRLANTFGGGLLPAPRPPTTTPKPLLVLDLDRTLIFADTDSAVCKGDFTVRCGRSDLHVDLRPRLAAFLQNCAVHYRIAIFTAASEEYARPIAAEIERRCGVTFESMRFCQDCRRVISAHAPLPPRSYLESLPPSANDASRPSTSVTSSRAIFVKDLSCFSESLERVVLVDDKEHSFSDHPRNGLVIDRYRLQPDDDELTRVFSILEAVATSQFADVRDALQDLKLRDPSLGRKRGYAPCLTPTSQGGGSSVNSSFDASLFAALVRSPPALPRSAQAFGTPSALGTPKLSYGF